MAAADRKWKTLFNDPTTRRDQVEATNEHGDAIGKEPHLN